MQIETGNIQGAPNRTRTLKGSSAKLRIDMKDEIGEMSNVQWY